MGTDQFPHILKEGCRQGEWEGSSPALRLQALPPALPSRTPFPASCSLLVSSLHHMDFDLQLRSVPRNGNFSLDWTSDPHPDRLCEVPWLYFRQSVSQSHLPNAPHLPWSYEPRSSSFNLEGDQKLAKPSSVSSALNGKQRKQMQTEHKLGIDLWSPDLIWKILCFRWK